MKSGPTVTPSMPNSTATTCCSAYCIMLASTRMMKISNSALSPRMRNRVLRAFGPARPPSLIGFRRGGACPARATRESHLRVPIYACKLKLLDFGLSYREHSTSHFLIDNFEASLAPGGFPAFSRESQDSRSSNRPSPRLETLVSDRKQRIASVSNRPKIALFNFPALGWQSKQSSAATGKQAARVNLRRGRN